MADTLSSVEQEWIAKLKSAEYGQEHLIPEGASVQDLKRLLADIQLADKVYPGGVLAYVQRARKLLADSKAGVNPFEGCVPEVPEGESPIVGTEEYAQFEKAGMDALASTCFVLVAGGLGERLGYPSIKIGLPSETATGTTYCEMYVKYILAFQEYASKALGKPVKLPLAIMVSGDTNEATVKLLKENNNFGMDADQITIMLQEKVPALLDNDARIAVNASDPYKLETKPHGHGDVHTLLIQNGLTKKWSEEGKKWVVFFQDTNGLIFRALPAVLGVSVHKQFVMNTVTVPRKPGEAVGGICKLKKSDGSSLTINVEYNQLDPLLKETGDKKGDVADPNTGNSKYPGNTNVLVFKLDRFHEVLSETNGAMPEFVNPKYKDASKTTFKSPTRLECMMQEFPRLLKSEDRVGFIQLEKWLCFSTVKNNVTDAAAKSKAGTMPEAAFSGESDAYSNAATLLSMATKSKGFKADIAEPVKTTFLNIDYKMGPHVVLLPSFGVSLEHMKERVKGDIKISARSSLVVEGDVEINGLDLDGALVLKATPGSKLIVKNMTVKNKGWRLEAVPEGKEVHPAIAIRGYEFVREEQREEVADKGQTREVC